ncbi:hypothetical protein Cni_G11490 [Canna indica]|uniref:BHLH domain-containing protein n=1 Tax=Canna indica TaxID=4628 RepID=A0AAQ3KBX2_9LILI|nr:hypothetical protein Cni_G11490 [Canna indica]
MVCQAATQTRFRALKYEKGIAGSSTIIVRVIACFQPLQDCQAEYFRHLLKPVTRLLCGGVLMKKYPDRWMNPPNSMWQFNTLNSAAELRNPSIGRQQQNSPAMVFPAYINPYGCTFSGNAAVPFPEVQAPRKFIQSMPTLSPPPNPNFGVIAGHQNRFLGFNQSWDQTSLIFSSAHNPSMTLDLTNQSLDFQGSNQTVSNGHGEEEMHEDTEEINALLYSDSDDEYCEEEASTGHSPTEPTAGTSTEVAASSVLPAKRKRVDVDEHEHEPDASLLDTASSAGSLSYYHAIDSKAKSTDGESSYARGEDDQDRKRIKRERILETVGVLRRIIPGGKGKDAATVLDEAICYLKSLKLKAKGCLAATPL